MIKRHHWELGTLSLSLSLSSGLGSTPSHRDALFIGRAARINTKLGLYKETSANHLPGQEKGHGTTVQPTANHLLGQEKLKVTNARMHPKPAQATQKKYAGGLLRSVLDPVCQEPSPPHSVLCHYLRHYRF